MALTINALLLSPFTRLACPGIRHNSTTGNLYRDRQEDNIHKVGDLDVNIDIVEEIDTVGDPLVQFNVRKDS